MAKPMPEDVWQQLQEARHAAITWLQMQYHSGLHTVNTGRLDKYDPGEFVDAARRGRAALKLIQMIKAEYS